MAEQESLEYKERTDQERSKQSERDGMRSESTRSTDNSLQSMEGLGGA